MNAAYTHVAAKNFLSNVQTETYWDSYQNLFEKNDVLWHEPQKDILKKNGLFIRQHSVLCLLHRILWLTCDSL